MVTKEAYWPLVINGIFYRRDIIIKTIEKRTEFQLAKELGEMEKNMTTRCWNHINFEKTEKMLLSGSVKKKIPFYEYYKEQEILEGIPEEEIEKQTFFKERKRLHHNRSHLFVLFYHNGLKVIFKEKEFEELIKTIFAYKISRLLDIKIVPPTVPGRIDGEGGCVQLFVENDRSNRAYFENLSSIEKGDLYLYIFLTGLVDTHYENILISKKCLKPVFVDLDTIKIIRAEFEEVPPFEMIPIGDPFLDQKDYKKLYLQKPIKSEIPPLEDLEKIFTGLKEDKILFLRKRFKMTDKNATSFFKHKEAWWVKYSRKDRITRYLLPFSSESLSDKTLRKLKKIDKKSIRGLLKLYKMDSYIGAKETYWSSVINGIFYRKNLIFKAIEKRRIH